MTATALATAEDHLRRARETWQGNEEQRGAHLRRAAKALRDQGLSVHVGTPEPMPSRCVDCDAPIVWRASEVALRRRPETATAMAIDAAPAPDGEGDVYVGERSYRLISGSELAMMHSSARRELHRFHRATCVAVAR